METRERKDPAGEDLLLQLTVKKPIRFKAGADLQWAIDLVVDVTASDADHSCSVSLQLHGAATV